jgi:tetratricopeptide (TPR) repeat protein
VRIDPQLAEERVARASLIDFPGVPAGRNEFEGALLNHARHYARLMQTEGAELQGLGSCTADSQAVALQHLRVDQRNMLRALDYALELDDPALLLSMAQNLRLSLELRSEFRLMGEQYAALLTEAQCLKDEPLELHARLGLSRVALSLSDAETGMREADAAEGLADALNDRVGLLRSWLCQGDAWWMRSQKPPAVERYRRSLELGRELGIQTDICRSLVHLARAAQDEEDYPQAAALLHECRTVATEHGLTSLVGDSWRIEGNVLLEQGQLAEAQQAFETSRQLSVELDNEQGVAVALRGLAGVAFYRKDSLAARRLLEESLDILHERGDRYGYCMTLSNLASVVSEQGDHARAADLNRRSAQIAAEIGDRHGQAIAQVNLGTTYLRLDSVPEAQAALLEGLTAYREVANATGQVICCAWGAVVLARQELYAAACILLSGARHHLTDLPSSHAQSCQAALVHTNRLCSAAVESGQLEPAELEQQTAIGEALELDEMVRYALRMLRR